MVGRGSCKKIMRLACGPPHPLLKQEETPASYREFNHVFKKIT